MLNLLENSNAFNYDVAKCLNYDKKIIRNLQCHVENKKNIDLNNNLISNQSHSERSLKLLECDVRRLINHVTKN